MCIGFPGKGSSMEKKKDDIKPYITYFSKQYQVWDAISNSKMKSFDTLLEAEQEIAMLLDNPIPAVSIGAEIEVHEPPKAISNKGKKINRNPQVYKAIVVCVHGDCVDALVYGNPPFDCTLYTNLLPIWKANDVSLGWKTQTAQNHSK